MKKKPKFTDLQARFVDEYLIDLNASRAAEAAGSTAEDLGQAGYGLLKNPQVRAEIDRRRSELREKLQLDQETVLNGIKARAFYDVGEVAIEGVKKPEDVIRLPLEVRMAIDGWSWDKNGNFTLKFADRGKALDQLARHLSLYNDSLEVNVTENLAERMRRAKARTPKGSEKTG